MKKSTSMFLCLLLVMLTTGAAYAGSFLRTGTYNLVGCNDPRETSLYYGKVIIIPHGENYKLIWHIPPQQTQIGTAILDGDVLSVVYQNATNHRYFGVMSFRVISDGVLHGRWAPFLGTSYGKETLTWESPAIN